MIWFFERQGERLKCEISRKPTGDGYQVVLLNPDGSRKVEDVGAPTELIERAVQLLSGLRDEGWHVG